MATDNKKKIDAEIGQALFSDTERFEMWFATYWKPATAAALVIAVLAAIIFWIASARSSAEKKAAFELADAASVEEISAALKKHSGHAGAAAARFRLAKLQMEAKKYQEASKEFDKVANISGADATLVAKAKLASGYACELAGSYKDAISRFLAVEGNFDLPAALRAEAGYCAGRLLLKAGDVKQAKTVLGRTGIIAGKTPAVAYWTENAKQTLIAIDNGEYIKAAPAKKAAPVKKAAAVKKTATVKKAAAAPKAVPVKKNAK